MPREANDRPIQLGGHDELGQPWEDEAGRQKQNRAKVAPNVTLYSKNNLERFVLSVVIGGISDNAKKQKKKTTGYS